MSYVFPLTRKVESDYNGVLELTIVNGRKVLDSANANYSYGSLQRILKFALDRIYSPEMENILLLGLGGGSVVDTLCLDFGFKGRLTAVELDPAVIRIAGEEFGIIASDKFRIVCADAFEFVKNSPEKYDLLIVDLFIDNRIPDQFLSGEFWRNIRKKTQGNGSVIFNTITETNNTGVVKQELGKLGFAVEEYLNVEKTNTLLLARSRSSAAGPGTGE